VYPAGMPPLARAVAALLASILLGGTALAGLQVSVQVAPDADFSQFATFDWMPEEVRPGSSPALRDPEAHALLRREIEERLQAAGLRLAEDPDLRIIYYVGVEGRTEVKRRGRRGDVHAESYREGTLILEMLPAGTERAVWRGQVVGAIASPERRAAQIRKVVKKLLRGFPTR